MAQEKNTPVPITAAGVEALKAELAQLKARRPAIVSRVAGARSDGDLRENFAYHDARQELGMLDGRLHTIEALLHSAEVVEPPPAGGGIALGSRVVVRDEFGEATYQLVGPAEVDVGTGKISLESPLGAALMGRGVGDRVEYETPGGARSAEIIALA